MLKQEDVGNYYTNEYGDIFQMIAYCPFPTVVMMDLKTGRKEHVVTDCLNAESYGYFRCLGILGCISSIACL